MFSSESLIKKIRNNSQAPESNSQNKVHNQKTVTFRKIAAEAFDTTLSFIHLAAQHFLHLAARLAL